MASTDTYCVYKHTSPSGKSYIGITNDYPRRCTEHQHPSNRCHAFRNAIQKYGWDNFQHEILEEGLTPDQAVEKESELISEHNTLSPRGYNLRANGKLPLVADEVIRKQQQTMLERHGVVNGGQTEQSRVIARERMSCCNPGDYSEEAIQKRRESKANTDASLSKEERREKYSRPKNTQKMVDANKLRTRDQRQEQSATWVYTFVSPRGETFHSISLKGFCEEHNLNADIFRKYANTEVTVPEITTGPHKPSRINSTGWLVSRSPK